MKNLKSIINEINFAQENMNILSNDEKINQILINAFDRNRFGIMRDEMENDEIIKKYQISNEQLHEIKDYLKDDELNFIFEIISKLKKISIPDKFSFFGKKEMIKYLQAIENQGEPDLYLSISLKELKNDLIENLKTWDRDFRD